MIRTMDALYCPLCIFSVPSDGEEDVYFLRQHFELSHPENGNSPFIALEDSDSPVMPVRSGLAIVQENMSSSDDEDGERYVQCPTQCGETVTLTELSSHMDLHQAEGIALCEAEGDGVITETEISPPYDTSTTHSNHFALFSNAKLQDSTKSNKPISTEVQQPRRRNKDHHGIQDWKDLLGFPSRKTRNSSTKVNHEPPYRLGVSMASGSASYFG